MYESDYREEVARGAALLDEHFGSREAWVSRIDTDELNLVNAYHCVLGQLFVTEDDEPDGSGIRWGTGGYNRALSILGLSELLPSSERHPEQYGFITKGDDFRPTRWQVLRDAWDEIL